MRAFFWGWLVLAASWVAGCRSERPTSYFVPGPTLTAPVGLVPAPVVAPAVALRPAGVDPVTAPRPVGVAPAFRRLRGRPPRSLRLANQLLINRFLARRMLSPLSPRAQAQPTSAEKTPATFKAGSLLILSGILVAVGGILLGIALGGAWVLLTGGLGLAAGVVLGMLGLFGALSTDSRGQIRLGGTGLLGLLVALGGVGLGLSLGGLLGVGAGLLLLGVGSFLVGWGIISNAPGPQPRPASPVVK